MNLSTPPLPHRPPFDASDSTLSEPVLRLRPRRAWLPRAADTEPACGWFESSRELLQGLQVIEWADVPALAQ
jgi:hypothetical protein